MNDLTLCSDEPLIMVLRNSQGGGGEAAPVLGHGAQALTDKDSNSKTGSNGSGGEAAGAGAG